MERRKITFRTCKAHGIHNLLNFISGQIRVSLVQKVLHVIDV